jgi:uncharacterized protein YjlB
VQAVTVKGAEHSGLRRYVSTTAPHDRGRNGGESNPRSFPGEPWDLAPHGLPPYAAAHSRSEGRAIVDRPTLIGPDAFHRPAAETPGVDRREAFADDHVWAGRSRTEAGTWSGWHVHPGHDTYVFQTQGRLRLEFGPGDSESVEGGPGDFVLIPKGRGAPRGESRHRTQRSHRLPSGRGRDPRQRRRTLIGQLLLSAQYAPPACLATRGSRGLHAPERCAGPRSRRSGANIRTAISWHMVKCGRGGEAASWFSEIARECAPGP